MKETKQQRVARKQRESIALERAERKRIGVPSSSVKTAERMLYDRPVDRNAKKEFRY